MLKHLVLAIALTGTIGCGDDDAGGGPPPAANGANPAGAGAAAKPGAGSGAALKTYTHVEEIVTEEERETIRHEFKERDFVVDPNGENRDPFQSYVVMQVGLQAEAPTVDPATKLCAGLQMVATNYSVRDLKLTGIVARGTRHYALMQDSANYGHIVARGDCVGREKARVKDIGAGYITFEITPEAVIGIGGTARPAEERSVQLYPGELTVSTPGGGDTKREAGDAVMPGQSGTTPNNR
ncbi:MAG: pilus assembly protein PilP [Kofleriaceae bacterium]|nr:pilus assembly protein PilP [Kofleriaceae bacterium]